MEEEITGGVEIGIRKPSSSMIKPRRRSFLPSLEFSQDLSERQAGRRVSVPLNDTYEIDPSPPAPHPQRFYLLKLPPSKVLEMTYY